MSSGKQKTFIRWSHRRSRWEAVYHFKDGARVSEHCWVRECISCRRQKLIHRSKTCQSCKDLRRSKHSALIKEAASRQTAGHTAVHSAVRDGVLADLRYVETKCTDCSARAVCYDHRDYRKPLEVDPVCRSCNVRRGPAIDIAEFVRRRFKHRAVSN